MKCLPALRSGVPARLGLLSRASPKPRARLAPQQSRGVACFSGSISALSVSEHGPRAGLWWVQRLLFLAVCGPQLSGASVPAAEGLLVRLKLCVFLHLTLQLTVSVYHCSCDK